MSATEPQGHDGWLTAEETEAAIDDAVALITMANETLMFTPHGVFVVQGEGNADFEERRVKR